MYWCTLRHLPPLAHDRVFFCDCLHSFRPQFHIPARIGSRHLFTLDTHAHTIAHTIKCINAHAPTHLCVRPRSCMFACVRTFNREHHHSGQLLPRNIDSYRVRVRSSHHRSIGFARTLSGNKPASPPPLHQLCMSSRKSAAQRSECAAIFGARRQPPRYVMWGEQRR